MQIGERFVSACLCPLLVWHHAGARHRTAALGEGEAQEHTWAPCEHTHHSVSSREPCGMPAAFQKQQEPFPCSWKKFSGSESLQEGPRPTV